MVDGDDLMLDVYFPADKVYDKYPVAVYIHGGGFLSGSKDRVFKYKSIAGTMMKMGYAVVSIDYRLLDGDNTFPDNIIDCKDAIRWIYKNADEYGFDTNNIGVWGTSAGGHLALMTGYTADDEYVGDTALSQYSSDVSWAIDLFGASDLETIIDGKSNIVIANRIEKYFGVEVKDTDFTDEEIAEWEELCALYSPVNLVSADKHTYANHSWQ